MVGGLAQHQLDRQWDVLLPQETTFLLAKLGFLFNVMGFFPVAIFFSYKVDLKHITLSSMSLVRV